MFSDLLRQARVDLVRLYATRQPPPALRAAKQARLAELGAQLRATERRLGVQSGYERWLAKGINNAELASVSTYENCEPGFQRLLGQQDGNLGRFYAVVRALAKQPASQRDAQVCGALSAPG